MELDERYRLVPFSEAPEVGEQDVIELWDKERVVDRGAGAERAREVACVGLDRDDGLVAVSTVYLAQNVQLQTEMWHLRGFVAEAHRRSSLGIMLLRHTRLLLEDRFTSGAEVRAPGIVIEVENEGVKQTRIEAVWADFGLSPDVRWTFIGENAKGDHVRVYYFPGAVVPPPG